MARNRRRYDDEWDDRPVAKRAARNWLTISLAVVGSMTLLSCGGCFLLGFIGALVTPNSDKKTPPETKVANQVGNSGTATSKRDAPDVSEPQPPATPAIRFPEYRELKSSRKFGRTWRAVVVPQSITRDELVALARHLHGEKASDSVRFFDDDTEYEQFRLWDENYPSPLHPFPKNWEGKHNLALLNLVKDRSGQRWELGVMNGGRRILPNESQTEVIALIE